MEYLFNIIVQDTGEILQTRDMDDRKKLIAKLKRRIKKLREENSSYNMCFEFYPAEETDTVTTFDTEKDFFSAIKAL